MVSKLRTIALASRVAALSLLGSSSVSADTVDLNHVLTVDSDVPPPGFSITLSDVSRTSCPITTTVVVQSTVAPISVQRNDFSPRFVGISFIDQDGKPVHYIVNIHETRFGDMPAPVPTPVPAQLVISPDEPLSSTFDLCHENVVTGSTYRIVAYVEVPGGEKIWRSNVITFKSPTTHDFVDD